MTEPEWIELTKVVGEINGRLVAGELENEGIRVYMEMAAAAWFYGAEDPNRLVTIYVLAEDLERAERLLDETQATAPGGEVDELGEPAAPSFDPDVVIADEDRGLRARPLRWLLAVVVGGALLFGFFKGNILDVVL